MVRLLSCILLIYSAFFGVISTVDAQTQRQITSVEISPLLRFAVDTGQEPAALANAPAGNFSGDIDAVQEGLPPYTPIWAVFQVKDALTDNLEEALWVVIPQTHGLIALDIFLVAPGKAPRDLLSHDIRTPFDVSEYGANTLRSAPFSTTESRDASLVMRMVHGPSDSALFRIERADAFADWSFAEALRLVGFYAFLGSCLLFFSAFSGSLYSRMDLSYAALFSLGLLLVAYFDNLLFRWIYPNRPGLHVPLGVALLFCVTAAGFLAAYFAQIRFATESRLRPVIAGLTGLALASAVAAFLIAPEIMAPVAYAQFALMLVVQVLGAARWDKVDATRRRIFWLFSVSALVVLGSLALFSLLRTGLEALDLGWTIKGMYGALVLGSLAWLTFGLLDIRRDTQRAREAERRATEARQEAETAYSRARDLADQRRMQMATMSHDIKQPLSALQMSLDAMAQDGPSDARDRMKEAFNYILSLTQEHLDTARAELADDSPAPADPEGGERYAASLILDTVRQMFADEAATKGIDLRLVPSSAQVAVPPLALMRITSNLVSNAIKYSDTGRVLAGVRRRGSAIDVQVFDEGPGMNPDEIIRFRQSWASGEKSEGHGLGLGICFELAETHGLDLSVASEPGRGTAFSLRIPVAEDSV